ncbi:MBL fold metallo-hydrolase [Pseudomonas aeruginosa]|uniref:MBL fold metallo-hydrolase n=1 Tax=Pseudomonas aeruginosa TaxID=287 RepID=UPI003CFB9B50
MMQSRMIGDIKVTRILEYAGPTHDPAFLFPQMDQGVLAEHRELMAPNHWIEHMNRLIVTIQFWIVHVGNEIVVIDTGVGNFKPRPGIARMNMLNGLVREWMTAAGAPPEKVTRVVITHLHSDHVGWNTTWKDGRWEPTFPNATYHVPRDDFDFCHQSKNKEGGVIDVFGESFFDSVMPIVDAGLAKMMQPGEEIADCLQVLAAPGHSPGQVIFKVRSQNEEGIFCGDILHSPVQIVRPEINSGYCIWEDTARQTRLAFLNDAADSGALILPVHFGEPHCGFIRRQGAGFAFEGAHW